MEAKRDENNVPVAMAVLDADGTTPVPLEAEPTSHILQVEDAADGADSSGNNAYRDENQVTTLLVVSEADGATPVQLYVDGDGKLLIDSN